MIGMLVSEQDTMDYPDLLSEQLAPQVRRRVNQQISSGQTKNGTCTGTLVFRTVTLADITPTANHWHTDRGAGTKQDHFPLDIL